MTLTPGLYETLPFTSIEVVPPAHLDDGIFVRPDGDGVSMPIVTIVPELWLVPRR